LQSFDPNCLRQLLISAYVRRHITRGFA